MRAFDRVVRLAAVVLLASQPAWAQTDYYNTDAGRPIRIEDAYATERHAFELQLAPLRLERLKGGIYNWGLEPELTYGILPRTHLEIGAPLAFGDGRRSGLAGIDLSVLHNLNVETRTLPALGIVANVLAPVGGQAPDHAYGSAKLMMTRTFHWARLHANGEYTVGPSASTNIEVSRWLAGAAIDRTFPLASALLTAEVYARQPVDNDESVEWNAGAGVRYQVAPQWALDAGIGRRLTSDGAWFVTFGTAYAFAIASLIRVPGR
jgi:hypothetical protein